MKGFKTGTDAGSAIVQKMRFVPVEGNIVPLSWFDHIKFTNGKPNTNAILVLADIVYWYRPIEERDEQTGLIKGYRKKFKGAYLQRSVSQMALIYGLTPKQAKDSIDALERVGVIKKHLVTRMTTEKGQILGNVPFIELIPEKLMEFATPLRPIGTEAIDVQVPPSPPIGLSNTETTTENTYRKTAAGRDTTTNNPLPSPRHTAAASKEFLAVQEKLSAISESLPSPFTGLDDLANTLLKNGKTAADVQPLWDAMQYKGNPAGAFLHAIKSNYTPKTTPVPKPDGKPKDGDTKMVNGVKKIFKSGKWYDFHRVSGGDG